MNRRNALRSVAALALMTACAAAAQPAGPLRVAWVSLDRGGSPSPLLGAFRTGMAELGYVEGKNLVINTWWGEGSGERLALMTEAILAQQPDVIVTQGGGALGPILRSGTKKPVVFGMSADPVMARVVDGYARPGGNVTGITLFDSDLVGKRMALLKEMFPRMTRVAILANPQHPGEQREHKVAQESAAKLGLALRYFAVQTEAELESAFSEIVASRIEAVQVFSDGFAVGQAGRIAAFSIQNRIPVVAGWATFAERGNLLAYGPVFTEVYRRVAFYVDQIRKGAKPGDLPIEQPTQLELVINLTTAKAIGVEIPQQVLVRANRLVD